MERQEKMIENGELGKRYDARLGHYRSQADGRVQSHLDGLGQEARIQAHADAFQAEWEPALVQVATANGIGESARPAFDRFAKMFASVEVDRTGAAISDIPRFLAATAAEFLKTVDEYHRAKSGDYARQAEARAAQPAPSIPVGGGAPPAPPAASTQSPEDILKAVYRETPLRLQQQRTAG
jgi:hypothetical protein